jgi:mannose/cellobiose epimerase-like protein (N-acyl-D-glucosamine 2-epimerase family)
LNGVRDDGVVIDRGGRTWTTTECIKGWIAASEVCGITGRASVEGCVEALFRTHLEAPVRGCWVELFDPDGRPMMDTVPASTLYHIFLSFSEVLRMWPSKNGPALLPA